MSGRQKIYVDFSGRHPEGHLYVARLREFSEPPALGSIFVGTDLDEFEVDCRVLAVHHTAGVVYHRPVQASDVPGTSEAYDVADVDEGCALEVSAVREPNLIRT